MGMLKEFRDFAVKGNAVDMAVGIIIGGAFGKIVTSLVNDIIMPPIGMLVGRVNFSSLAIELNEKTAIKYGVFLNNILDFVIVAFCIFMVVRQMNRLKLGPRPNRLPRAVRSAYRRFPSRPRDARTARRPWRTERRRVGQAFLPALGRQECLAPPGV